MTPPVAKIRSEIHFDTECCHSGCSASLPRQPTRRARDAAALADGWTPASKDGWHCPKHRD
jgi:Rieske Fe-S protein